MQFDFSHLYKRETVDVVDGSGNVVFSAVCREITHGEKSDAQAILMQNIDIPTSGSKANKTKAIQSQMKKALQGGATLNVALQEEVAGIESWTLKDAKGGDVPVCVEAWRMLPEWATSQIERVIERLNPDLDDEFQD